MGNVCIDLWLYGPVARYAGDENRGSYANLEIEMPAKSTLGNLIQRLGIPTEERGITFVNGHLAALPGVDAGLEIELHDGDRVGISHRKSMWPFQYRFGAQLAPELEEAFRQREDRGLHHAYTDSDKDLLSDK
jgi:hypothetical protein